MRIEKKMQRQAYLKRCFVFVSVIAMAAARCFAFEGGSWTAVDPSATIKIHQIAVGNENTVIGRDRDGNVYELFNGAWKPLSGGKARWIAAGSDGSIFAVGKDTRKLYHRSGDAWEEVPGIDKLSRVFVLDKNHLWGTLRTKEGSEVWQFENGKWARPLGADGQTPAVNWNNVAVAPGVFLVTDHSGNLMMRSSKIAPAEITPVKKPAKKVGKKVKKKTAKKKKKAAKKASKKKAKKKSAKKKKKIAGKKAAKKPGKKKTGKKAKKKPSKKKASKKKAGKKKTKKQAGKKKAAKKKSGKKKASAKKKKSATKKSASKKKSKTKKFGRKAGATGKKKKHAKSKKAARKKSAA